MQSLSLLILLVFAGGVFGGKGGRGGGRGRSKGGGGGGWFFGGKNKKPSGQPNYPRQPPPEGGTFNPQSPASNGLKPPENRPPAYNPGYNGPPPAYSKNQPAYPQSGGHAPPPPYSQYPQQGHYPNQQNLPGGYGGYGNNYPQYPQHYGGQGGGFGQGGGYGTGGFGSGGFGSGGFGNGGFGSGGYGGFGQGGGYFGGYPKRRGFGSMGGIIPIPIPIPIGGGGFGYGSYGGGYYRRNRGSSEVVRDGDITKNNSAERPRILAPPDYELDGVTELPGDMPVAPWDIVGKETSVKKKSHKEDSDESKDG